MAGGTDLKYSRQAADYIKSQHTEVIFTADEAFNLLKEVVYATETWDPPSIRASTG